MREVTTMNRNVVMLASILVAPHLVRADKDTAMASIPGGTFTMGHAYAAGNKPHSVTVASFAMDVNLVTVADYTACVKAGKCSDKLGDGDYGASGKDKHPINGVNWEQAKAYCAWAGKRLPTAEEWEYAGRGGDKATDFSWGNEPATDKRLCFRHKQTCEVGSFPAGAFGLYDMNGQVRAVDVDSKVDDDAVAKGNPAEESDGRAFYSVRQKLTAPLTADSGYGFRCAR